MVEAHPFRSGTPNPLDTRASALNLHSIDRLIAGEFGRHLHAHAGPIHEIHVSHRGHFGSTLMSASDHMSRRWVTWWKIISSGRRSYRGPELGSRCDPHCDARACAVTSIRRPWKPRTGNTDSRSGAARSGRGSTWFDDLGITVDETSTPNHAGVQCGFPRAAARARPSSASPRKGLSPAASAFRRSLGDSGTTRLVGIGPEISVWLTSKTLTLSRRFRLPWVAFGPGDPGR